MTVKSRPLAQATALAIVLAYLASSQLTAHASPGPAMSITDKKVLWQGPNYLHQAERLELALEKAKSDQKLASLAEFIASGDFRKYLAQAKPEQKLQIWAQLGRLDVMCKSSTDTENSAICLALLAQLENGAGHFAVAEQKFKDSIARFKLLAADGSGAESERRNWSKNSMLYRNTDKRSKIALALLYCQQKRTKEAEQIYDELMQPLKAQNHWFNYSDYTLQTYVYFDGNEGDAMRGFIASLAHSLDEVGETNQAAKKYEVLCELSQNQFSHSPKQQAFSAKSYGSQVVMTTSSLEDTIDPIIGSYPSLEEGLEWYLSFDSKHPPLWRRENLAGLKSLIAARKAERESANAQARLYKWLSLEAELLPKLDSQPDKTIAEFKRELETRRKEDPKEPCLTYSLNGFGYRLIQLGRYLDAEAVLKEAVQLREQAGPQAALGQSYSNLALLYLEQRKLAEAKVLIDKAIVWRADDSTDRFAAAKSKIVLGRILAAQGKLAEAEAVLTDTVKTFSAGTQTEVLTKRRGDKSSDRVLSQFSDASKMMAEMQASSAHRLLELEAQSVSSLYRALALIALASVYTSEQKIDLAKQCVQKVLEDKALKTEAFTAAGIEPRAWLQMSLIDCTAKNLVGARANLNKASAAAAGQHSSKPVLAEIFEGEGLLNSRLGCKSAAHVCYKKASVLVREMLGASNCR